MFSIAVPIFNEGTLINRLHSEIYSVMEFSGYRWEVIYVNDGSEDNSLDLLMEKLAQENNVVIANLSCNWGYQAAITSGHHDMEFFELAILSFHEANYALIGFTFF